MYPLVVMEGPRVTSSTCVSAKYYSAPRVQLKFLVKESRSWAQSTAIGWS